MINYLIYRIFDMIGIILIIFLIYNIIKDYKERKNRSIQKKPWGEEELLFERWEAYQNNPTRVKLLRINARESISKQYHNNKVEMLVCLKGTGIFEMNGIINSYEQGFRIFVDTKDIHRITAYTDSEFIELSNGHQEDIIRVEDDYGRV